MDKQKADLLLSKGKKYKKWLEGMLANPFYNVIVAGEPNKMFQLNYDYMIKDIAISMENQQKNIRYPKYRR